ncbi:MAG: hypothetical protein HYS18_15545 [Burkholderiales bacterium]|nr:hypothetical protein [Burkholderiales bacterium]
MFMVYWTVGDREEGCAHSKFFASSEMGAAMHFMEQLRMRKRAGESIGFVTMCSENPQSVGQAGVADPAPDYNWKKRRR